MERAMSDNQGQKTSLDQLVQAGVFLYVIENTSVPATLILVAWGVLWAWLGNGWTALAIAMALGAGECV
jgi:hypothetical protein